MTAKKTIKKSLARSKSMKKGGKKPGIRKSRTTEKKSLSPKKRQKVTQKKPSKFGKIEFDLTTEDGFESLKHALYGAKYYYLIESLYQEVFRPHLKYDEDLVNDEGGVFVMDEHNSAVVRAIFNKCIEHFRWEE